MNKRCADCPELRRCESSVMSWVFFTIGLIAAFSVRLVAVFMDYNVLYAKIAWYVGVIGFFVFFLNKFYVDMSRSRLIDSIGIAARLHQRKPLNDEDYKMLDAIFCALKSNKDRINYFVIFSTSLITIAFAIYADFLKK
ncbi:MAG: hypothetical protein NC938_06200 [Candidatus Omnitrophica bacterium]|nr:hypothetical protein [Candidatus Omnitrophota bacterium]